MSTKLLKSLPLLGKVLRCSIRNAPDYITTHVNSNYLQTRHSSTQDNISSGVFLHKQEGVHYKPCQTEKLITPTRAIAAHFLSRINLHLEELAAANYRRSTSPPPTACNPSSYLFFYLHFNPSSFLHFSFPPSPYTSLPPPSCGFIFTNLLRIKSPGCLFQPDKSVKGV